MWTVNFLMFKLVLEKAEEPDIKLPTSAGSWKKQESSRKNFCFIDYAKAFDCVDHNKLWEILQEMGIPDHLICLLRNLYASQEADHLICLLRNLYASQEATVKTGHGTTDWFQIGKGVRQGCISHHSNSNDAGTYRSLHPSLWLQSYLAQTQGSRWKKSSGN